MLLFKCWQQLRLRRAVRLGGISRGDGGILPALLGQSWRQAVEKAKMVQDGPFQFSQGKDGHTIPPG